MEGLRRADDVHQLEAEALAPAVEERRRQRLARGDAEAERREVEALPRVLDLEHPRVEGRHREEDRRPLGRDDLERPLGRQALRHEHRGAAGERREVERVAEAERERHLRGRERAVLGAEAEDAPPDQLGGGDEVLVRVDRGLGRAGRARRVAPVHRVLARRRGGGDARARRAAELVAGHDHVAEPRTSAARRRDARRHVLGDDGDPRPAVPQEELVLAGRHQGVHGYGDSAELHGRPERGRERRRVGEGEEHAVLGVEAATREVRGEGVHAGGQLGVRQRAAAEAERGPRAAALGHVPVDEEGRGVEGGGQAGHARDSSGRDGF